jgi:hypothetical protein
MVLPRETEVKKSYVKIIPESPPMISIDDSIKDCLICVKRIVDQITFVTTKNEIPDRETVQTLKDCLSMLFESKKKEQDFLDSLTEEQLLKLARKRK